MVKLTKIYTKTGDDGTTGLVGGIRVRKDDLAVEAYGTVDEANAAIGLAIAAAPPASPLAPLLTRLQHDLFDLGADLATPRREGEAPNAALRIVASQTARLEALIDEWNGPMPSLTSFVLPGGSPLACALHLARTITRRAERIAVSLLAARPDAINPEAIRYLNRLSDLLFVLARVANDQGRSDVLWVPGSGRGS